ncbi:MAG TPA: hypothetical protein VFX96_05415, partial [Pyrinomonadaceae bacterium]|nr:hypothetical protein [Pyrinomonadaceae bacterium]
DWNGREFLIKAYDGDASGNREKITSDEMWAALRVIERQFNDKERFIRDCFDALFNRMGVFAHYLRIRLVELDDVIFPFDYYLYALNKNRAVFDRFTESYHPRAAEFIRSVERRVQELEAEASASAAQDAAVDESRPGQAAEQTAAPEQTPETVAPEPAYFMFDCWPRPERYFFMLEDAHRIEEARAILNEEVELYIRGSVVEHPAYYNEPWAFHVAPSSIAFGDEMPEFAERINELWARQMNQPPELRKCVPRLLAEMPPRWFAEERANWERDEA